MDYNPFNLKDKTILITGASSGIGRCTAIECSRLGAKTIIIGRNKNRLNETFQLLKGNGHIMLEADLTDEEQIKSVIDNIPIINGAVQNAGLNFKLPISFLSQKKIEKIFAINTIAPALLTRYLLKNKKITQNGSIVFTSSISGVFSVDTGNTIYSMSKCAIDGLMKNAAIELAGKGIRVNSVNPGFVDTPIHLQEKLTKEQIENEIERYPIKRIGKPEDIAWGIIYLLSDASSWVTGISLKIDGGFTLN